MKKKRNLCKHLWSLCIICFYTFVIIFCDEIPAVVLKSCFQEIPLPIDLIQVQVKFSWSRIQVNVVWRITPCGKLKTNSDTEWWYLLKAFTNTINCRNNRTFAILLNLLLNLLLKFISHYHNTICQIRCNASKRSSKTSYSGD